MSLGSLELASLNVALELVGSEKQSYILSTKVWILSSNNLLGSITFVILKQLKEIDTLKLILRVLGIQSRCFLFLVKALGMKTAGVHFC